MDDSFVQRLDTWDRASLIPLALNGERDAFETLYSQHQRLGRSFRSRFPSPEDCEQAYEDVFRRSLRSFDPSKGRDLGGLIGMGMKRAARSAWRRQQRTVDRHEGTMRLHAAGLRSHDDDGDLGSVESADVAKQIVAAVRQLAEDEREVMGHRIRGFTLAETAARLRKPHRWVDNRYQRAKKRLQATLPPELWEGRAHRHPAGRRLSF